MAMHKLTKAKVMTALKDSAGILTTVAQRLNCSRQALYVWLNATKDPEVMEALKHEEEKIMDLAESKIVQAITERDMSTVRWYSMTKGKSRGYAMKQEVELTGNITSATTSLENPLSKEQKQELIEFLNERRKK